jgi:hypothetical protein
MSATASGRFIWSATYPFDGSQGGLSNEAMAPHGMLDRYSVFV